MTWHADATPGGVAPRGGDRGIDAATLASFLDADRSGPARVVRGVGSLDGAGADELAFCRNDDPDAVEGSDAGIVVCPPAVGAIAGRALVHSDRPRADFVRAVDEFFRDEVDGTRIHPSAVVEDGATIGAGCTVGAGAYVAACVTLGDRCTVGPGSVLGGPGFGFARAPDDELVRQVHEGGVVLEDDVAVGGNCTIDRAVFDETVVRRGTKLSGNVHLAHQVELGADATVAFGAGFAGGARVGDRTTVHPHVAVATDVTVGTDAVLGMNATVLDDVPAGATVVGSPAAPVGESR